MAADPIHQFRIIDLFPVAKIGHTEIVFTNSAAFMLAAVIVITAFLIIGTARRGLVPSRLQSAAELSYEFVAKIGHTAIVFTNLAAFMLAAVIVITAFLIIGTARRGLVPSRLQSAAELSYEFVATTVRSTAGSEGMKFFPFVFTLFMFILAVNMIGLIPFTFTVTSHIIVTAALAITVFLTVLIYGLWRHSLHFFNLFVPKGVPIYILPLIVFIEILSFVSRPISHSVRLFANMLAGHI